MSDYVNSKTIENVRLYCRIKELSLAEIGRQMGWNVLKTTRRFTGYNRTTQEEMKQIAKIIGKPVKFFDNMEITIKGE